MKRLSGFLAAMVVASLLSACVQSPVRTNLSSGTKWEPMFGFSRAVQVDNMIYVSGTTAWDENGDLVGKGDAYAQTKQILKNIEVILAKGGADMSDVVRTRIYVTRFDLFDDIAKAHSEAFGDIRPATTMVAVGKMLNPDSLVEIDVDVYITE